MVTPSSELNRSPVSVLYVAGAGRSGSTLLELLLGEALASTVCAGELTHLWQRGALEDQLCGCGKPFSQCEVWQTITAQAGFASDYHTVERLAAIRHRWMRLTRIPAIRRGTSPDLREYTNALEQIYRAISEVRGACHVLDSSKYPPEAWLLHSAPSIHASHVHLVRDARAVAYSWQRHRQRPEIHWAKREMPRYSPLKVAVAWVVFNRIIESVGQRSSRFVRIRYEDLVTSPVREANRVATAIGVSLREELTLNPLQAGENHTVSGNPLRFKRGDIMLHDDNEWRSNFTGPNRLLVDLITAPMRQRYRYTAQAHHPTAESDQ